MKYLLKEIYEKACLSDDEADNKNWNEQCQKYHCELERISHRLPKPFLKQYDKYHFHDNIINSISIKRIVLKSGYKYELTMHLEDYHNQKIEHILIFTDIKNLNSNLSFSFAGNSDWIYSEILAVNEKRLSLEAALFEGDSTLYFEFFKLHYKKMIHN